MITFGLLKSMRNFRIMPHFQLSSYISFHTVLSHYKARLLFRVLSAFSFFASPHSLFFLIFFSSAFLQLASLSLTWNAEVWIPLCSSFFFHSGLCLCLILRFLSWIYFQFGKVKIVTVLDMTVQCAFTFVWV